VPDVAYLRPSTNAHQLGQPLIVPPPDPPAGTRKVPEGLKGEWGSGWDEQRLFAYFQDDLLFMRGPIEDYLIEGMLQVDGKARSIEQVLTLPVRGASWQIEPAEGDKGQCKWVTEMLTAPPSAGGMRTPIHQFIAQAASACLYRRAHFEKVITVQDGMVVYADVAFRPATTCYLARSAWNASFQGFLQWTWLGEDYLQIYIPAVKSFVYIHGQHRNPILGISDLDVAYVAFESKQKLRFLWSQFLENQTIPKAYTVHSTGDEVAAGNLARQVATLKGGGVVGLTAGQDVKAFESNGQGAAVFQAAINYLDSEMTSSVLASFLDLATAAAAHGTGSYALSLSQTDFYLQSRQAVLREMEESITNHLIAPVIRWNFGKDAPCPRFRFGGLAPTSNTVADAMTLLTSLAQAQLQPGDINPLPQEFTDQLTVEVAKMINLPNPDKLRKAIDARHAAMV
jgi:hypothetical protein